MNLQIISLAFIFLSISCNTFLKKEEEHKSRDFFDTFMKTVIGSDMVLDKDCLAGEFDDYYIKLNNSIITKDLVGIAFNINRILNLENEKCPIQDLKTIFDDFKTSWNNGNTWVNIMKHSDFMKEKIKEFAYKSPKTPKEVGLFTGVLFKALVYGYTQLY